MQVNKASAIVLEWLGSIYKPAFAVYVLVILPITAVAYLFGVPEQRIGAVIFLPLAVVAFLYFVGYLIPVWFLNRRARLKSSHKKVIIYDDHQILEFLEGDKVRVTRAFSVSATENDVYSFHKVIEWNGLVDQVEIEKQSGCEIELIAREMAAGLKIRYIFDDPLTRWKKTQFSYSLLFDNSSGLIRHFTGSSGGYYKAQNMLSLELIVHPPRMIKFMELTFYRYDGNHALKRTELFKRTGQHRWDIVRPQHTRKYTLTWEDPGPLT
jgi:hypothetical protein